MDAGRLVAVVDRELSTVWRTRAYLGLALGFVVVVNALAWTGSAASYATLSLDLLVAVQVLVPVLAAGLGYRAVLADAVSGELEVLRSFPVDRAEYVLGVYLGRLAAVLVVVLVALLSAALVVPLGGRSTSTFLAGHAVGGSFAVHLRFVVLTALFAAVALAAVVAVSALARSVRGALAVAVVLVVLFGVGLDVALVAGLATGVVPPDGLPALLALSPTSAFRGLVLDLVVSAATTETLRTGSRVLNLLGLLAWLGGALAVAGYGVWRVPSHDAWRQADTGTDDAGTTGGTGTADGSPDSDARADADATTD